MVSYAFLKSKKIEHVMSFLPILSSSLLQISKTASFVEQFFLKPYWFAEVESRTQGSRPRPRPITQKKSEAKAKAKDSLSEDRISRGQGQECSRPRPRTKDTGASVLLKKRSLKKFFRRSPIHWRTQNF